MSGLLDHGSSLAVPNITVEVRVEGTTENGQKGPTVKTKIILPVDIPPADFFSRMYAQMNVDPATATLGWKEAAERRNDPHNRLSSNDDLKNVFNTLIRLKSSSRRKKEVIMEVANLEVQPNGKTIKKPRKPSETAVTLPELRTVQSKLSCAEHPGKNKCCYVMGPKSKHPGKPVALGIDVILLWARMMSTITPPSILNLDELAEKGRAPEECGRRGRGQPALPPIHVHVGGAGETALRDVDTNSSSHKRAREYSESESDSDDDLLTITDVPEELHIKYPALSYPQYLQAKRICYATRNNWHG
ncbi:hypothetical protein B0H19DRAFT_1082841 [Mycena capillaripes]|nr:hypothetical protein B0H19DRAFT_1082841 [Mycena capillaripes]